MEETFDGPQVQSQAAAVIEGLGLLGSEAGYGLTLGTGLRIMGLRVFLGFQMDPVMDGANAGHY